MAAISRPHSDNQLIERDGHGANADAGGVPDGSRRYQRRKAVSEPGAKQPHFNGGHARNRTGVRGFAVRCVTTPPRGPWHSPNTIGSA